MPTTNWKSKCTLKPLRNRPIQFIGLFFGLETYFLPSAVLRYFGLSGNVPI